MANLLSKLVESSASIWATGKGSSGKSASLMETIGARWLLIQSELIESTRAMQIPTVNKLNKSTIEII